MLTRNEILGADDIARELVAVPEWGGEVWVQSLSGAQRDRFEQAMVKSKDGDTVQNVRASLAAWSIVDNAGVRVFSDADVAALGQKNGAALDRVFTVAQRLSGFGDADVEGLVKNSSGDQSDDSTSD